MIIKPGESATGGNSRQQQQPSGGDVVRSPNAADPPLFTLVASPPPAGGANSPGQSFGGGGPKEVVVLTPNTSTTLAPPFGMTASSQGYSGGMGGSSSFTVSSGNNHSAPGAPLVMIPPPPPPGMNTSTQSGGFGAPPSFGSLSNSRSPQNSNTQHGGGSGTYTGFGNGMSLQNQLLSQFAPHALQQGPPVLPAGPPPSHPGDLQAQHQQQQPAGSNNVAGRRLIMTDHSIPSASNSLGGSMGGSLSGSMGGKAGSGSTAGLGLLSTGGMGSGSSPPNFSTAAAIGDTESDMKRAMGTPGDASLGGKLRDPKDKGPKQCIVKFLAPQVTEQELRALFQQFGPVEYSRMIYDSASGSCKGYGFVYYYRSADAADAVKGLDSFELYGRYLRVGFAIPQRAPPTPAK